ncbi:MAG: transporter related protein [Herbinix sp.]|nr:transporter related protein [Herbinix sp.]
MIKEQTRNSTKMRSSTVISRVFSYIKQYKLFISCYMFLAILGALINLEFANIINTSINSALNHLTATIISNMILASLVILVGVVITYLSNYLYGIFKARIMNDIRNDAVSHLQKLPLSFIEDNHTGDLISRFTGDLTAVQSFIGDELFRTAAKMLTLIISSVYLISINWKLFLVSVILMPPALFFSTKVTKPMSQLFKKASGEIGKANSLAQDSYGGIYIIKAFHLEDIIHDKFSSIINTGLQYEIKGIHKLKWLPIFNIILWSSPFAICLIYGSFLSINHEISPGQLPAFVYLLNNIVGPFSDIPRMISNFQMSLGKAERLFEILDQPAERTDGEEYPVSNEEAAVQFKDVSFSYGTDNAKNVLSSTTFILKPGSITALVGISGCGKSTVLKLLSGFYDEFEGTIELFGHSLREWSLEAIRAKISLVTQDTYLFPMSVFDNIQMGRLQATYDEVIAAAKAADAHEFIMELPSGYDTYVGERGIQLSGGQRQRISLARAFLKDSPIILLDEPTSALDTISEASVKNAMFKLMEHRTVLIVTHRLSTIKDADEILVLEHGEIIEKGTHDELISRDSHYLKLYKNQT